MIEVGLDESLEISDELRTFGRRNIFENLEAVFVIYLMDFLTGRGAIFSQSNPDQAPVTVISQSSHKLLAYKAIHGPAKRALVQFEIQSQLSHRQMAVLVDAEQHQALRKRNATATDPQTYTEEAIELTKSSSVPANFTGFHWDSIVYDNYIYCI